MAVVNKYGLSRDIDAAVKRAVRQRDGFGCVICGSAVYTYEHVDPEFVEARVHDPACITLLCAGCHGRVTKGLLSKASVQRAMTNPKCKETGFSFGPFDLGAHPPTIQVGPVTARNVAVVIQAMGDDILRVESPEELGGPFRISAVLANQSGTEVLRIERNEWQTPVDNWDVQVIGPKITIHNGPGDIALDLVAVPPTGITVERLNMFHKNARLMVRADQGFVVRSPGGAEFTTSGATISDSQVAISVSPNGIAVGQGGGSVYIENLMSGTNPNTGWPTIASASQTHSGPGPAPARRGPYTRLQTKTGRNQPCPCGSGLKYKRCHGS
jgi:hypothetical protein